mgnify:CR=1 FL=1
MGSQRLGRLGNAKTQLGTQPPSSSQLLLQFLIPQQAPYRIRKLLVVIQVHQQGTIRFRRKNLGCPSHVSGDHGDPGGGRFQQHSTQWFLSGRVQEHGELGKQMTDILTVPKPVNTAGKRKPAGLPPQLLLVKSRFLLEGPSIPDDHEMRSRIGVENGGNRIEHLAPSLALDKLANRPKQWRISRDIQLIRQPGTWGSRPEALQVDTVMDREQVSGRQFPLDEPLPSGIGDGQHPIQASNITERRAAQVEHVPEMPHRGTFQQRLTTSNQAGHGEAVRVQEIGTPLDDKLA